MAGAAPQTYSAPPDPLAALRGPTSKGGGGEEERKGREGGEGEGPVERIRRYPSELERGNSTPSKISIVLIAQNLV